MTGGRASLSPAEVGLILLAACRGEIEAIKPGNVGLHGDGHGMSADDFFRSAELVAPVLSDPSMGLGERLAVAEERTMAAVGCNTNLGIVLLLGPLAEAVLVESDPAADLRTRLERVLAGLSVDDARGAYRAIRCAQPAGLGQSDEQDVAGEPTITLLEAMRIAADRDRIARQYVTAYSDVFELGLPAYQGALDRGWEPAWALVAGYLRFMAAFPDTHITREWGVAVAEEVRREASGVETRLKACENPRTAEPMLLSFDKKLKGEGLNPGTSADLTVATLAAFRLKTLLELE